MIPHQTVALGLHCFVALVDGEVEWRFQVGIDPGLPLLYLEVAAAVSGHQPYDQGYRNDNERRPDKKIVPRQVVFDIEATHFAVF